VVVVVVTAVLLLLILSLSPNLKSVLFFYILVIGGCIMAGVNGLKIIIDTETWLP